jgi:hypothetical protein
MTCTRNRDVNEKVSLGGRRRKKRKEAHLGVRRSDVDVFGRLSAAGLVVVCETGIGRLVSNGKRGRKGDERTVVASPVTRSDVLSGCDVGNRVGTLRREWR